MDEYKDLMEQLGAYGYHTFVRFDPLRSEKRFTIMVESGYDPESGESPREWIERKTSHRVDTDQPLGALRWLARSVLAEEMKND